MSLLVRSAPVEPPRLLVLARHGLSLMNHLRYYSLYLPEDADTSKAEHHNDFSIPLMPEGHEQAHKLGALLKKQYGSFDVVCYSDHRRSVLTKNEIVKHWPPNHRPEQFQHCFFNERDNGYFYGKKWSELVELYGETFMNAHRAYWDRTGWFRGRPFGGESIEDLANGRAYHALNLISAEFSGQRVLVVGHGTWIRAARVLLEGQPTDTITPPFEGLGNCGFVAYTPDEYNLLRLECYRYDTDYMHRPIPPD